MLSLIICSRKSDIPQELKENIKATIGVDYELVVIDNSHNDYSIFSAYNEGVRRAKGDLLCFMHEDILFKTENWGSLIKKYFGDKSVGILGFAGAHFLPSVPIYWFSSTFISEYNLTNDNGKIIECYKTDFYNNQSLVDVVACDGFCFFARKEIFEEKVSFDTERFDDFHYYDMDICMQAVTKGYRVCLCKDILIEHYWSERALDEKGMDMFQKNQDIFFNKWKDYFPISRGIDFIPEYVLSRINRLYMQLEAAKKVRKSKSYRLGAFILRPFKYLFKRNKK